MNMNRLIMIGVILFSCAMTWIASASQEETSQLTPQQKTVNRQTLLNDITDYFATVGESDLKKASIIKERKDLRRVNRLKKLSRQKSQEALRKEKEMIKANKELKAKEKQK